MYVDIVVEGKFNLQILLGDVRASTKEFVSANLSEPLRVEGRLRVLARKVLEFCQKNAKDWECTQILSEKSAGGYLNYNFYFLKRDVYLVGGGDGF